MIALSLQTVHRQKAILLLCLVGALAAIGCGNAAESPAEQRGQLPVIRGNISNATADKPQSKLWYARNRWWAWLPTDTGNRIWSRGANGWSADETLEKQLHGLTGRADVWADNTMVCAVLVASNRLAVVSLQWVDEIQSYRLQGTPTIWDLQERSSVETATIARDTSGRLWIAYDQDRTMWVRHSENEQATKWSPPFAVSEAAARNDFCTIVTLADDVGIFWSDHVADAFLFRRHKKGSALDEWEDVEVITQGPGAVDDHLNAVVADNGTLYVATRTGGGIDRKSHLQLHVRQPSGEWGQHNYGYDTETSKHSRPIVFLSEGSRRLHLCHSVYTTLDDGTRTSHIACLNQSSESLNFSQQETAIITAALPVNSVTGPKAPLPADVIPIVFASDTKGNIYEGQP